MSEEEKFIRNWQAVEKAAASADPAFKWQAGDALFYLKYGGAFIIPALISGVAVAGFGAMKYWHQAKRLISKTGETLPPNYAFLREEGVSNLVGMVLNTTVVIIGVALAAPLILKGTITAAAVTASAAAIGNAFYFANNAYNFLRSKSGAAWMTEQKHQGRTWQDPFINVLQKTNAPLISAAGDVFLLFGAALPHRVGSAIVFGIGATLSLAAAFWAGRELGKAPELRRNVALASKMLAVGTLLKGVSGILQGNIPNNTAELFSLAATPVASVVFATGYLDQARLDARDYYRAQAFKRGLTLSLQNTCNAA